MQVSVDQHKTFTQIYNNHNIKWGFVYQYQNITEHGISSSIDYYKKRMLINIEDMKPGGSMADIIKDPEVFYRNRESHALEWASRAVKDADNMAKCAAFVFGHSVLDYSLFAYLKLAYDIDQSVFWDSIKDREVKIKELIGRSPKEIIKVHCDRKLENLERVGILKKMKWLLKICSPEPGFRSSGLYEFNREKLKKLDNTRHDIIHQPEFNWRNNEILEDLDYIHLTGMHFMYMMHKAFGLKIMSDTQID